MVTDLSDEAWALLGMLHRAFHGGPPSPDGFVDAYSELHALGLATLVTPYKFQITDAGERAVEEHFLRD